MSNLWEQMVEDALNDLSFESGDWASLVNRKLYHTINDRLNEPANTCRDLLKHSNPNIPINIVEDLACVIDPTYFNTIEEVKKAIMVVFFTMVALDTIISKGKELNKEFITTKNGTYHLEELGFWDFSYILRGQPLYLCLKNNEDDSKVDINIGLKAVNGYGWMNWPMKVSIVDEDLSKTVPCDFITCLEDLKFNNLQRALNVVKE